MGSHARNWVWRGGALVLLTVSLHVVHVRAGPDSAAEDARVHGLAESFRCLVCQNQTLADSNADLAADLRERIREQVRAGATDAWIRDYMVRRYGDFVLYRPPLKPLTWALWFGPFAALAAGAWVAWRAIGRRRGLAAQPLDHDERRRVDALMAAADEGLPR
ncbi:cytochrome c-type biogenesis protein [Paraburkholderia fungorum]|uniref:Cytochrome c-type biogenesis protein n=1 Tax=Paraburkholderia fungorum TaxID=134537 RepID=A0A3R7F8M3_9BURK|nr:cytochrome c-type biogenesis protein [Paraburkholderia fungorum]RKF46649.1 cytochrome C biogenesis protein [Paraburkholderia fungorum]